MTLKLVAGPTVEPVALDEAKLHCRVDVTADDFVIQGYISAARAQVENDLRRALCTQTWDLYLDAFPAGSALQLPLPPLQSVTSVKYTPLATGVAATLSSASYTVDTISTPGWIVLNGGYSWPTNTLVVVNGVVVRFVAGYGEGQAVPPLARQAMLLLIAHWYENREAVGTVGEEIRLGYERLLWAADRHFGF